MNNIAFDFDGVICDVHHIFRGHFWDMFGHNIAKEEDQKDFQFTLPASPHYEHWWWREIPVAIVKYQHISPPVHGSIEALESIYKKYGTIQIITAREPSDSVMQVTKLWCEKTFPFEYDITFLGKSEEKYSVMKEKGIEYFVDDRYKTAQEAADQLKVSFLFNAPWNDSQYRKGFLKCNVYRVNNLFEMKYYLDGFNFIDTLGTVNA